MSQLFLDAQALYAQLLQAVRQRRQPQTHLVGITSGGAWLAQALHKDLAKRVDMLTKVAIEHDNEFGVVWELLGEIMGDSKHLKH